MIVRRLRLHPFGCFAERELRFARGLTVVLGPNEAGKSTMFAALKSSLLRSRLTKKEFSDHLARYLPAGGGDTARIEMEFEVAGKTWLLKRRWGASPSSELALPGGGSLVDDEAIRDRLESVLPARQGTFWKVLMAGQAELMATVDSLQSDPGKTLADLGDILRAAVLETGGVSVDRFRSILTQKTEEAFANWDREHGRPKNGRGIENPWKREVGEVLGAWYRREELRVAAAAALAWEKELDELNARLREASAAACDREAFVNDHGKAAADAGKRRALEAEAGKARLMIESLTALAAEWPRTVERIRSLEEAVTALAAERAPLERERQEAEQEEEGRKLREKAERVARRKEQAEQARQRLAAIPKLEKQALQEIRNAARELERHQAGLEAGRLSVTVAGRRDVEIVVQEDFAAESAMRLAPGAVARLRAAGRLRIVHPDLEVEVRSGEADAEARVEKARAAEQRLAALLAAAGVASPAEAESRWSAREPLAADAAAAEKTLAEELADEPLAALEKRSAAIGPSRSLRPVAAIAGELARKDTQIEERKRELDSLRHQAGDLAAKHGSPERLIVKLADARSEEKGCLDRIASLAPLPRGFSDADGFLRQWEEARRQAAEHRAKEGGLREQRSALEARPPEQSSEELASLLADAEGGFQSACRRAESLARISRLADELAGGSDSAVTSVMRADLEKTLAAMTDGRYARVDMDGALPVGLVAGDEKRLGREHLSVGTKDTLALALRLVMARRFLAGADGFLVMDDPLVDMDPERQRAAAGAMRDLAAEKQLILFTCQPSTARLLGGTLVEL